MAAKTTIESNGVLAVAVAPVQAALAAWRKARKHREAIPQPLWRAMVSLARGHGLSPVARALKVNYTWLKDHLLSDSAATPLGVVGQPGFVEVALAHGLVASATVIELEDRLGLKLTVRLVPGGHSEALVWPGLRPCCSAASIRSRHGSHKLAGTGRAPEPGCGFVADFGSLASYFATVPRSRPNSRAIRRPDHPCWCRAIMLCC